MLGILLFPGFELLDVFGPAEVFGSARARGAFDVRLVAERGGEVASAQGPAAVARHGFADCPPLDVVLVPGGIGTRREVENAALLGWVRERAAAAELVLSVCTGAALLARAGVLDGLRATTNKAAFAWAASQGPRVDWVREARWVDAGRVLTSAGVSAGIDLSLHVVARTLGADTAEEIAAAIEHEWHRDPRRDPFARIHGLVP